MTDWIQTQPEGARVLSNLEPMGSFITASFCKNKLSKPTMRDKLSFSCKHTQTVRESQALIRINTAPIKTKCLLALFLNSIIIFLGEKGRQGDG